MPGYATAKIALQQLSPTCHVEFSGFQMGKSKLTTKPWNLLWMRLAAGVKSAALLKALLERFREVGVRAAAPILLNDVMQPGRAVVLRRQQPVWISASG